ncbi:hypothetical protein KXX00_005340 [Aspergillus fumigatus]|nr:hypothetical protein KXX69_007640 [Aspergillus fumigatus]KAH1622681.1 hypothetical protein KXX31_004491 [Aspergillus fumigatus]KAH3120126.1 hypothetical protein KXX00_005340 [Aspergillus fumigatus]
MGNDSGSSRETPQLGAQLAWILACGQPLITFPASYQMTSPPFVSDAECRFLFPPLLVDSAAVSARCGHRHGNQAAEQRTCGIPPSQGRESMPGAKCVVNDPTDMSVFDPASVLIIQRLDQIESLLQQQQRQRQQKQSEDSGPALRNTNALDTIRHASAAGDSGWTTFNSSPVYQTHGSDLSRLTIETILSWSVFEGKYDAGPSLTDLLSSPTTLSQEPFLASIDPRHERLDLDLRTCTRLLHTFLEEVHIANPILDGPLVTGYLYQACIHGIGWDAPSCLVLLICALGAISESFHEHHEASSMTARQSPTFHLGQRYFEAAQMRLGAVLRTHGVLEAQCFFYSGVYLMAIFQPLRAWRCFVQAAAMAETLLFSYGGNSPHAAGARLKSETRCLETTHWACLKSELELRLELGLNQPDPLGFTYPTFFPTVPMQQLNRDESRVWYFYLAETAVRRLTMRIVQHFFLNQRHGRFPDAHKMREVSLDFEIQASDWTTSLPPVLTLSTPEMDDDVLKFVLRGHLLDCYEWIYFPYLLEAIAHAAPRNPATDEFVVRGLAMAAERIHKNRKGFRHRHHGVWLMLRSCTRSALLLVAASRAAGGVRDMLPVGWKAAVRGAVEMLAYWRDEAGDARERLRVLEEVVAGWGE